ncbi:DUF4268 domain-containing protein [Bergeyella zoohelcum]|uniref:DUF4268 domain-containing protein n=1 Tax=Bergeyella zoohelcum TaxID=1015 RepID=UPI002A91D870|nr:DUF4268 domain-containing protein [Bergeyella zoohelcum]MDY6024905.1 DUF4268 domain-containing protein [Bergeyella zoohelcum]
MFSKAEAVQLKKEFWTAFGKSFPRKWLLYNTKIKDFSFKFYVDNRSAGVFLDIEMSDAQLRALYFEKIDTLSALLEEYLGAYTVLKDHVLENGKMIHRFSVMKYDVSVFNKASWQSIFEFFVEKMTAFETFFWEYEDYIKAIEAY